MEVNGLGSLGPVLARPSQTAENNKIKRNAEGEQPAASAGPRQAREPERADDSAAAVVELSATPNGDGPTAEELNAEQPGSRPQPEAASSSAEFEPVNPFAFAEPLSQPAAADSSPPISTDSAPVELAPRAVPAANISQPRNARGSEVVPVSRPPIESPPVSRAVPSADAARAPAAERAGNQSAQAAGSVELSRELPRETAPVRSVVGAPTPAEIRQSEQRAQSQFEAAAAARFADDLSRSAADAAAADAQIPAAPAAPGANRLSPDLTTLQATVTLKA